MSKFTLALFFTCTIIGAFASAQETYRRLVNFEWEAIEDAKSYEIELQQVKDSGPGKTFSFKVKEAVWNGRLSPGKYMMKLRSRDYRGVPGDWSPASEFNVGLDSAPLKNPAPKSKIDSGESTESKMTFQWAPVGGAEKYKFELLDKDGKVVATEEVKGTEFKTSVPVASTYTWKVNAISSEGIQSEAVSVGEFTLLGKPIDPPKVAKPESDFVRELSWTKPEHVSGFDLYLLKYDETQKKWSKFKVMENYQETTLPFEESWPGGRYQLVIKAKGDLRTHAPLAKENFKVRGGNRSPAAEYTALVRKSIDRVNGWYGIASYLITQMQFKGTNMEKASAVSYSATGGTGRMGLGWFGPDTPWGFLGIIDLTGFTLNGKTQTFASAELNSVYRLQMGDRGELRFQGGAFYKELPETVGIKTSTTNSSSEDQIIKAAGPHLGAEYWYSLSPKLGIQFNTHIYMSMMGVNTPNGQPLEPTMSTQLGVMGSYRFTPTFTGLVGYAMREDKVAYKAKPDSSNFAVDGDVNESTILGNYLNFFAEWSF